MRCLRAVAESHLRTNKNVYQDQVDGTFKIEETYSNPITVSDASNPVIYKFWSYNGGLTVFMEFVGKFI